jgi:small subunit ribosomal protein S1
LALAKNKADMMRAWTDISKAAENGEVIEGTVIAKVKGGLNVDIGVTAFLPGSQIDLRPVRNMDGYLGKKYKFKVIKFNKKRGNIVLSRRALLEEERESPTYSNIGSNQRRIYCYGYC